MIKVYDVLNKNENGTGNGVGALLGDVPTINELVSFMKEYGLQQCYCIDENIPDVPNCFYLDEFIKEELEEYILARIDLLKMTVVCERAEVNYQMFKNWKANSSKYTLSIENLERLVNVIKNIA